MKKPSQKLIDAFFEWFEMDRHARNEDYYRDSITLENLSGLSKSDFITFFRKFANEGGKVQSGGYRTVGKLMETIESNYKKFRTFVLMPFETDFDEEKWIAGIEDFKYFGVGLATIYLNRVDKKRFAILNNKAVDSLTLFDLSFSTNTIKRYQGVRDAQQQLIIWFPRFDNFYRTDALAQFLMGEKVGRPWKEMLEADSGSGDEETVRSRHSIWKISHGKVDFSPDQRKTYLEQHTVHTHKDTKRGQGLAFATEIKEGDLFYLCHGNDDGVRVFGRITSPAGPSPHGDGWLQRSYDVVFEGVKPSEKYEGVKKGWTPNYNSTCMRVPDEEHSLFESEILEPFFGKRLVEIPGWQSNSPAIVSLPERNLILYGPPGTGKTYALRNEYMTHFTDNQVVTRDQFAQELAGGLTWLQVITIVLYDLGPSKVSSIFEHPLVQAKTRLSANQSPKNTIWGWLQRHTRNDCPNVKFAQRSEPQLFTKDEHSVWSVDRELVDEQLSELTEKLKAYQDFNPVAKEIKRYEFVTFHQSYSYEDFVEGIKPVMSEDVAETLTYEIKPGIFRIMVDRASDDPNHEYALLIDEINRGNVASIFGELIALIEGDKRKGERNELRAQLPYSREELTVPGNLYIIGAMNTADRSVEALDTALRRRFTFVPVMPNPMLIEQPSTLAVDLRKLLITINGRIEKLLDKDHCIGHSYFMRIGREADPLQELRKVFATKIVPLLEEYFYGDPGKIGMVLGERFIVRKDEIVEWAVGDWGMAEYEEPRVYALQDPMIIEAEDFRSVYE